jgi:glutathione S-transferase
LKTAEFGALNPRRRAPVLVDGDFALAESAAILEYIEDRWPSGPALFVRDPRSRAIQRRIVREADAYLGDLSERLVSGESSHETLDDLRREFARSEEALVGDFLTGGLSAVDFTVYPFVALSLRLARRKANIAKDEILDHVSLHGSIAWKRFHSFRKLGPRTGSKSLRLDVARGAPIVGSSQRIDRPRRLTGGIR